jgi:hypothetical protein
MPPKLIEQYNTLKLAVISIEDDLTKAVVMKNKAAGTRARIKLMEIKTLAHEMRKGIVDLKK